ncbi:glycine betaine ABC transporter substrate-binding protein [Martelella mediterranea]|uniref:Choline-binding protein n=1 Tax=Martelella mediterranea DSM 17316 TaxID=1122214 RepID=A0A1U9Z8G6_9HYPH|nr:glycine betaine ABC transporter substrate-binding protein [Martelella mediterranea]AQZ53872.1 Choline-binding protein precursor [Martelella mediterranea DSM 17316]
MKFASILTAALIAAAAAAPAKADPIKVGSKNFTEQYILGEIYAALLENAGYEVDRKINLGGTLIAHQALTTGEIDLYPEYTGTALSAVVKGEISSNPDAVYHTVQDYYADELGLVWLEPTGINNGYAIVVRQDTADEYTLATLSDLAGAAGDLIMGGGPEFPDRADGLPGLKVVYGIEFKEFKQFAKLGLRYDALLQGDIDVANGYATDWQIGAEGLVPLDDDKGLFPPYYVAPVVRAEVLEANPGMADVLNALAPHVDNAVMRKLNAEVEQNREEPEDVAKAYLEEIGLINN